MEYTPVRGKTYSLFGEESSTQVFYKKIEGHLNTLKQILPDEKELLEQLQHASGNKKRFSQLRSRNTHYDRIFSELREYLTELKKHLNERPVSRLWDGVISTREHQYLVYFLEFALVNRINKKAFKACNYKLALLPHCIRISIPDCKARYDDLDMMCIQCNKDCFIAKASHILKKHDVKPYIWMRLSFGSSIKKLMKDHGTLGILGIACIPELIEGMRKCMKYRVPVVGLPLDANRCVRWMGGFYENSVNLHQLDVLLS